MPTENATLQELSSEEDLEQLFSDSEEEPKFIFKHSNLCFISNEVFRDITQLNAKIHIVVVQDARDVSDRIEQITGVRHESPQALIIEGRKCIYSASHYDVDPSILGGYLNG